MIRLFIFFFLLANTTGCLSWFGDDEEDSSISEAVAGTEGETKVVEELPEVKASTEEEIDLKIAKLWSRVSELEEQLYRQKEKVRVLEKGLMLGLVPEEMKDDAPYTPPKPKKVAKKKPKPKVPTSPLSPEETKEYQNNLAKAHDTYRAGRYGVAIKMFTEVDEKFGAKLNDGVPQYWIAKCWGQLKEYSIAHQMLVDFTQNYPGSPFLSRGKLEMARIQMRQGLRETAIENFRMIIDQYPYEDAAEMAKMELQRLESTL